MLGRMTLMQTLHAALPSGARESAFPTAWVTACCPLIISAQLVLHRHRMQVWIWAPGGADMVRVARVHTVLSQVVC